MENNFKVIRVEVIGGAASVVAENLGESKAWAYADELEEKQMKRSGVRVVWYCVTNAKDWKSMVKTFWDMRRVSQPKW